MSFKVKLRYRWNKLRFYLSFLLLAFYLTLGGFLLFTDEWSSMLPKGRVWVGIILIVFGGIRFYIAYRRFINKRLKIRNKTESKLENSAEEKLNDSINV